MSDWLKKKIELAAQFNQMQSDLVGNDLSWMQSIRQQSFEKFLSEGFPKRTEENWKYTDLSILEKKLFTIASANHMHLTDELINNLSHLNIEKTHHLVFIDGCFIPKLSNLEALPEGVQLMPLSQAFKQQTDKIEQYLKMEENHASLLHLNTALITDGVFLYLPKNCKLDQPVRMLFLTASQKANLILSPRNIIFAENHSECTLLEEHVGIDEANYFKNTFTQIFAAENAKINYYKIQNEGVDAVHLANTQIYQRRNSIVHSMNISLGARLARDDLNIFLRESNAECLLNGLYVLFDQQHIDHHTRIDHQAPHCKSVERYKGILAGESKGVFNGKVVVHPNAQKTSAQLNNQNLLMCKTAEINSKPELEIYADDVKCTHGATVGRINAESLFYLRARGIDKQKAIALLTCAFANEIVERIEQPGIFEYLHQKITEKIDSLLEVNELGETVA